MNNTNSTDQVFIQKLTEIIQANLSNENFGVNELAQEIGMSHLNLHRKLKSTSNQTISQFIREIRLKKAKELLLNEDLTVSEISYRVGFGSPTYFNNCFHEYFGYPPGESRKHEFQGVPNEKPENASPKKPKRTKFLISLIIGFIVIVSFLFYQTNKSSESKAANAKEKSIAILPFKYLSGEQEKQYLADGIMDDILLHLSKIKDLRVISRTSVEQYRKTNKTARTIGQEMDVAYLLEGSLLKDGDQVRLIVQLIKTSDESHVWSNEYDRDWKEIFSVQSEVAETIASELHAVITPEEKQLIRKSPTANLTAYDFYQRGNFEFAKFYYKINFPTYNWAVLDNAKKFYSEALKLDSTFAQAYVGLALISYEKDFLKNYFAENYLDSLLILANKAISFDDHLAEAYRARGFYFSYTGNHEQALIEYDKAIQLNPNEYEAYYNTGVHSQDVLNDAVKAIKNFQETMLRNRDNKALPDIIEVMGDVYLDAGFSDRAIQFYQKVLALNGDSVYYNGFLSYAAFCTEDFQKAFNIWEMVYKKDTARAFQSPTTSFSLLFCMVSDHNKEGYLYAKKYIEYLKKSGEIPLTDSFRIGYALWQAGKRKEAKYYFDLQIKYGRESIKLGRWIALTKEAHFDLAATYAFLGDKEKAYQYLDEFVKKHSFKLVVIALIKHDPIFNGIRQEPRFQKIIKEMEAKHLAEHNRFRKWLEEQKML